jgi:hypothetical protein
MASIFRCSVERLADLEIQEDVVRVGDIHRRKAELVEEVVAQLTADTTYPPEVQQFLETLDRAIE